MTKRDFFARLAPGNWTKSSQFTGCEQVVEARIHHYRRTHSDTNEAQPGLASPGSVDRAEG